MGAVRHRAGASRRSTDACTVSVVQIVAGAEVCEHVLARGGVMWLRSTRQRCCFGALTSLRAATSAPRNAEVYRSLETDLPIDVRFLGGADLPEEIMIELRGLSRKHLVALWDGCKFKL